MTRRRTTRARGIACGRRDLRLPSRPHVAASTWAIARNPARRRTKLLYVRSGEALKRLALSASTRCSQTSIGSAPFSLRRHKLARNARGKARTMRLYPLLDITTTLDPQFNIAYRFGAVFLAEGVSRRAGPAGSGDRAAPEGIRRQSHALAVPAGHRLRLLLVAAGLRIGGRDWFQRASIVPGAPEWLAPLAAVTLTKGGDRAGARVLWEQLLRTGEHDYLRRIAEHRLVQLRILDELDLLNDRLARLRAATGRIATSWAPLAARGWVSRDPPADPAGVPYVIDPATGVATVSRESPFYPLPVETVPMSCRAVRPRS